MAAFDPPRSVLSFLRLRTVRRHGTTPSSSSSGLVSRVGWQEELVFPLRLLDLELFLGAHA
jgi:hypothetical protein